MGVKKKNARSRKKLGRLSAQPTIEELQAAFDERLERELEKQRSKSNARASKKSSKKKQKPRKRKSRSLVSKDFQNRAKFRKNNRAGRLVRSQKARKKQIRARTKGVRSGVKKGDLLSVEKVQHVFKTPAPVPVTGKIEAFVFDESRKFFRSFGAGLYWFKAELSIKASSSKRYFTRWASIPRSLVSNYDEMAGYAEEFLLALNVIFVNYAGGNGKTKLKSIEFEYAR